MANDISEAFGIPTKFLKPVSATKFLGLVKEQWLLWLVEKGRCPEELDTDISDSEIEGLLALSNTQTPQPWVRIFIKIKEQSYNLQMLMKPPDFYTVPHTLHGHLDNISQRVYQDMWNTVYSRYGEGKLPTMPHLQGLQNMSSQECVMGGLDVSGFLLGESSIPSIIPVYAVKKSGDCVIVIEKYISHTIHSILAYSPAIVNQSIAKPLFLLYQLLKVMLTFHRQRARIGDLSIHNVLVDSNLWIYKSAVLTKVPTLESQLKLDESCTNMETVTNSRIDMTLLEKIENMEPLQFQHYYNQLSVELGDLPILVDMWVNRKISNFKYLLILNHLAGRRMGDPNHHPVLPWVMDFSGSDTGLRDLTVSKFRLNKGDHQLDLTFQTFSSDHIPHHVPDVLSDITYYVYKARQTPKSTLCRYVRSKWVPNEYPHSMQRMQEWTPDECIPEFFTEVSIFTSIHEDLPDLELPCWCRSAEDFVMRHREVLESDSVSEDLHHWIDLTFGFKLSGSAAVQSKNVNLRLVDNHTTVLNHGVVQLFQEPHPHRIPPATSMKPTAPRLPKNMFVHHSLPELQEESHVDKGQSRVIKGPENDRITLPKMYDPLADLNQLEASYVFSSRTFKQMPKKRDPQVRLILDPVTDSVWRDMQSFACLACEIFLKDQTSFQDSSWSLEDRFSYLCQVYRENPNEIPRCIASLLEEVLYLHNPQPVDDIATRGHLSLFKYPTVSSRGLPPPTPAQILHPFVDLLPFPGYFPQLYECICNLRHKDQEIDQIRWRKINTLEKDKLIKVISREKVTILQHFLEENQGCYGEEGIELVLPYVRELFTREDTAVQAAWSLFNLIGQELGQKETARIFLPYLVRIFNVEQSTPKHMKIYHRLFLVQLLVRLGLNVFIHNFSSLLVEASAGYRDYVLEDLYVDSVFTNIPGSQKDSTTELPPLKEECVSDEESQSYEDTLPVMEGSEDELAEDFPCILEDSPQAEAGSIDDEEDIARLSDASQDEDRTSIHSLAGLIDPAQREEAVSDLEEEDSQSLQFQDDAESPKRSSQTVTGSKGMVRSETDEFARTMSEKSESEVINIKDVATESIKWLSRRLGCVLTAKFLSRNLIRMLTLCYLGDEQLITITDSEKRFNKTSRLVFGDRNAHKVLECLSEISQLYGEQVVLLQYIPSTVDMVALAKKRLTQKGEAGLISALVLMRNLLPLLSDSSLMDTLQETIIKEVLGPTIKLVSSPSHHFPGGSSIRTVICHKLVDVVYVIGLRLGFEQTRNQLTGVVNEFFASFNQVYGQQLIKSESSKSLTDYKQGRGNRGGSSDDYCNIKIDSSTQEYMIGTPVSVTSLDLSHNSWTLRKSHSLAFNMTDDKEDSPESTVKDTEKLKQELADVFNPELAMASYIPFLRIFGNTHMEQFLPNEDLIRQLCSQYDMSVGQTSPDSASEPTSPIEEYIPPQSSQHSLQFSAEVTGNKIEVINTHTDMIRFGPIHRSSRILTLDPDETKCEYKDRHKQRHLKGNWLAYWEHELGLSERDSLFNFKQIRLQSFEGHTSSIRALVALNNENSFISASKDKTVKLWSIKSFGDGNGKCKCQETYKEHKKSIFSIVYLDSVQLVASCDSTVHIWDPFTSEIVRQLDSNGSNQPITAMTALPSPSTMVITATNESMLRYLDLRSAEYAHEFKTSTTSAGLIRSLTCSPDNSWIAIGFSSGLMSLLDQRTGYLIATWKGHEGEILQVKAFDRTTFVSTSFDNTMKIWNSEDLKDACILKGHTEPAHCFTFYRDQVISATTGNKIGVHSSLDSQASFTSTKLRSDTFKGVLTSLAVLPQNRTLLLGADNGSIKLLC
ncbi:WD repeat-containing protein 81-like isoform X3 [Ostrea edulis]|uniref:WD repeat-containing protein 81-like isoform X3 n=1 Tax=Ostrea edulis TaxID=37623 RepID=UPI0024AFC745|nr:WD repeat-containing protein 81-like isoform X3 [Ostrea edulis]